jgi:YD repeat-containing protein
MKIIAKRNFERSHRLIILMLLFFSFAFIGFSFAETYTVTYQYDASSRLTGVEYSNGTTIKYTYDGAGNMTSKIVSIRSECAECSESPVDLMNVTFESGRECICSDGTSITLGTGVTVENGASIIFKAPTIRLKSGFKAKPGSVVKMQRQ